MPQNYSHSSDHSAISSGGVGWESNVYLGTVAVPTFAMATFQNVSLHFHPDRTLKKMPSAPVVAHKQLDSAVQIKDLSEQVQEVSGI